jgi:hypothetical protein
LTGAVRGLIPAFATLAGPAAIGAVAVNIIKATSAFKDFAAERTKIDGVTNALVEGAKAAFALQQNLGNTQKVFASATSSINEKKSAVRDLNRELRNYNLVLNTANITSERSAEIINQLIEIRKKEAQVTALNAEAGNLFARSANLQALSLDKSIAGQIKLARETGLFEVALSAVKEQIGSLKTFKGVAKAVLLPFSLGAEAAAATFNRDKILSTAVNEEVKRIEKTITFFGDKANELEFDINKIRAALADSKDISILREFDKAATDTEKLAVASKVLNLELEKQTQNFDVLGRVIFKSAEALSAFREEQAKIAARENQAALLAAGQAAFGGPQAITRGADSGLAQRIKEAKEQSDALRDSLLETNQLLSEGLLQGFTTVFAAISQGESPIKGLTNAVKQLVVQFAAAAAAAALLNLLTGGTAGTFKGIFGAITGIKFASGGVATRPTLGVFGEAGPEAVIPLSQLANIIGNAGGGGATTVTGSIRGNEIYLTNQRAGASYQRLFG